MKGRLAIITAVGLAASAASADRLDMFVFENADNGDISGLDLWVDVVDQGTHADFVFHNDSTVASFVRSIYVEKTDFSDAYLANGRVQNPQPAGVDFEEDATPEYPPGAIDNFGGVWLENLFSGSAVRTGPNKDGVDPGEWVAFEFDYDGIDFATLWSALTADDPAFRLAMHVQGVDGAFSIWAKNGDERVVPLPSAAGLSLAGIGLLGLRRRR